MHKINSLRPFWPEAIFLKSVNNVSFFIKFICINKTTYKLGRTFRSTIWTYSRFSIFTSGIRIARAFVSVFFYVIEVAGIRV